MNSLYSLIWEKLNQNISKLHSKINISFEFFPPNSTEMQKMFWESINRLSKLNPNFISITYNVNLNKNKNNSKFINNIKKRTGLIVAPHLTCINSTPQQLKNIAQDYWIKNIRHIIALRGDPIISKEKNNISMYAIDLVTLLKKIGNFDISVAAYPELHPEAKNAETDLIYLKKKIDAGANRAITQFFFNVNSYLRFRDLCASSGIKVKIIPGILPIFNFRQLQNFIYSTKVKLPYWIFDTFNGLDDDIETRKMLGAYIAINMVKILSKEGVRDFHFYTLNRYEITYAICHALGIK